ncbi:hypothetical protein KL905_005283 [Ogataea polymorpha]|uniref:Uncharacterized protein n=1 Tax=Ogataea polymorpha TaxID=460523 RepID=A0A1B7SDB7_9ASCO|nr:uncharacterized protein OGAPODRAFT_77805 [Ogataea polymorpha]KAG7876558.1 hypothetical protein KL937_005294 [Ogataea polymorpha]KAG7887688.1 hypothetical protein KL908_005339 [Ogataea polymorpha]KAG7897298.1 hypothetical protein KL935_005369 [Ogataea polymorpha]KAG7898132.1 hypothetical protein KL907_005328 [Ogataea polymorpha]KAG7905136.1 hypothetical protein KL906_005319 [Ogataea polymorpha]
MKFHTHTLAFVLQLVSLAFLILALVSVPISAKLALSRTQHYAFGSFGYCDTSSNKCEYSFADGKYLGLGSGWKMSNESRKTLCKLILATPAAVGLTLVSSILVFWGHFRWAGRSAVFWAFCTLLAVLSFAGAALVCVSVVLLFFPHITWTGWLLVPAAALNLLSLVLIIVALKVGPRSYADDDDDDKLSMFGEKAASDSTASFLRKPYTGGFTSTTRFPTRSSLDEEPEKLRDFTVAQHESGSQEFGSSVFNEKPAHTLVSETAINSSTPELKLPDISNPYLSSSENTHSRSRLSNRLNVSERDLSSPVASSIYSRDERLKLSSDNLPDNHSGDSNEMNSSAASDFTSVSQREINPKYYKGAPKRAKLPGQYMPAPNAPPLPYSGPYYPQQMPVPVPPPQHQPYYAPSYNPPKPKTRADILFNNNPDFAIGGAGPRRMAYKKFGGGALQGMHPGMIGRDAIPQHMASGSYKNRPRPNFPAASLSKDSPYGRL